MADWPADSGCRVESAGANPASSGGTVVTASASTNTKGAWAQLIASTSFTSQLILVIISPAQSVKHLFDIGIGAAGSEIVVIPDIHVSEGLVNLLVYLAIPITVPTGSRVAIRGACSTASSQSSATIHLLGPGFDGPVAGSSVTAYGTASATSRGTSVDSGATANTKGAWTQIVASTSKTIDGLLICAGANAAATAANYQVDIAVGASGSEQILIADYRVTMTVGNAINPHFSPVIPVSIPAGSRLAIRMQSSSIVAAARLLDFALYGVS